MPKNTFGGSKAKSSKNNTAKLKPKTDLIIKETDQEYAKVIKLYGSNMLELQCFDGVKRLGLIRGSMRKKEWITLNDIVLISIRDYQDNKCDIIAKYSPEDVRTLIKLGQIDNSKITIGPNTDVTIELPKTDEDCSFVFEDI